MAASKATSAARVWSSATRPTSTASLAEEVTVRGRVQGSIRARKVLLCSTCHVEGNILHEAFAVETGAFFEGNCRHADNPLAEEAPKKAASSTAGTGADCGPGRPAQAPTSAVSSMVSRPHGFARRGAIARRSRR